jgi:D-alanine-D-alanine ligase
MKKKILVLMGGISGERKISILSGKACVAALKKKKYLVSTLDVKGNFIGKLRKIKPDIVFNALHGRYGEDGFIQSILEKEKIKYTHSGVLSSSIAIDKEISKKLFIHSKILTPKYLIYDFNSKINIFLQIKKKKISFPVVIKPINEGSSLGVYICSKKNIIKKIKLLKTYSRILIEKYIPGREIQVAVMEKKSLGAIELKPKRKFYDYYAKYYKQSKTEHIMPAPLSAKNYKIVLNIAKKAHQKLGCKGITRSDFKFHKDKFYLLEVNTQPGMTELSLVPEIAAYKGIKFEVLVDWMIKNASCNR